MDWSAPSSLVALGLLLYPVWGDVPVYIPTSKRKIAFKIMEFSPETTFDADFWDFDGIKLEYAEPVVIRRVPMYASKDSPKIEYPGDENPWISVEVQGQVAEKESVVQLLLMQTDSIDGVLGIEAPDGGLFSDKTYCCDETAKADSPTACTNGPGALIDPSFLTSGFSSFSLMLDSEGKGKVSGKMLVLATGQYVLVAINCDPKFKPVDEPSYIILNGTSIWINPYGYLPGHLYGFLQFYTYQMTCLLVLGVVWFGLNAMNWLDIIPLQNFLTAVLFFSMVESSLWFYDYKRFNLEGVRNNSVLVLACLMTSFRRSFSRMVLIAICSGFQVVRPILGDLKNRIGIFGLVYYAFDLILELRTRYGQINEFEVWWWHSIALSIPILLLDLLSIWWSLKLLADVNAELRDKDQTIKLKLFSRLKAVLYFYIVCTGIFSVYEIYYEVTDELGMHWSNLWIVDGGFSQFMAAFMLLLVLCILRPGKASRGLGYARLSQSENERKTSQQHAGEWGAVLDEFDTEDDEIGDNPSKEKAGDVVPLATFTIGE